MSRKSIPLTGVTNSKSQINKNQKKKQKKNLKNKLSDVKKNKLVEDILKDWENDGHVYSEDLDLDISGILPITNEVVPKNKSIPLTGVTNSKSQTNKNKKKKQKKNLKNKLSDIEKDKLVEELLKDWENDD